jgi:hypothetical protein|tara:strand:+ start:89 stop:313 length:225 start_codon:yes stop_codon:yes gene_type:complete
MKDQILNGFSRLIGRLFSFGYRHHSFIPNMATMSLLDAYISVRRSLPVMADGNHWGNHYASNKKPWKATQKGSW